MVNKQPKQKCCQFIGVMMTVAVALGRLKWKCCHFWLYMKQGGGSVGGQSRITAVARAQGCSRNVSFFIFWFTKMVILSSSTVLYHYKPQITEGVLQQLYQNAFLDWPQQWEVSAHQVCFVSFPPQKVEPVEINYEQKIFQTKLYRSVACDSLITFAVAEV